MDRNDRHLHSAAYLIRAARWYGIAQRHLTAEAQSFHAGDTRTERRAAIACDRATLLAQRYQRIGFEIA